MAVWQKRRGRRREAKAKAVVFAAERLLHVPMAAVVPRRRAETWLAMLRGLCDAESFCVENDEGAAHARQCLLRGGEKEKRWYASFVARSGAGAALAGVTMSKKAARLVAKRSSTHAWVFVGANEADEPLRGRALHTDDLAPDTAGTWHLQLVGRKNWFLQRRRGARRRVVTCHAGDVLFVDTRRWYHRTELPPRQRLSASIAFDFGVSRSFCPGRVSNVPAVLASRNLKKGTVVFTEDQLPDCQLPRRAEGANCEVVLMDDDDRLCLVAATDIPQGHVLSVPPSDDDASVEE
mmetsp:Transcript_11985/g.36035  ORF Transcript_11985/g.36035 Transcript_11985/m.36035 type:complete len:293 (-) Transcript_11985:83-961(-)